MIAKGARGDVVRNTQFMLAEAGLYQGKIDGQFGPVTEKAVKWWQKFLGARADGVWGPDTNRRSVNYISALNPSDLRGARPAIPAIPAIGPT